MNQIEKYHKILREVENDNSLPENKSFLIKMLNSLIRSDELVYRYNQYFKNSYYLGYFLIQSQRIERTVVGVIESAELLHSKTLNIPVKNLNTNIPLGALITLLKNYIIGEDVFIPLTEFNNYRKTIIHRLSEDFSKTLEEIEKSIVDDYSPNQINDLQIIILEVSRQVNQKIADHMDDSMIAKQVVNNISKQLKKEIGTLNIEFEIIN